VAAQKILLRELLMAEQNVPGLDEARQAAATIRETAKWLSVAFAAIGAALIAGVQLSNLGGIDSPLDQFVAVTGLLFGLCGVSWAIWLVTNILTPGHLTLASLADEPDLAAIRQFLHTDPGFLKEKARDVNELKEKYHDSLKKRNKVWEKYINDIRNKITLTEAQPEDEHLRREMKLEEAVFQDLDGLVNQVRTSASYELLRLRFQDSRKRIFGAAIVTLFGICLFAWATSQADKKEHFTIPEALSVDLTSRGREFLIRAIGENCVPAKEGVLRVVGIREQDGVWEVVTIPADNCKPIRFTVTDNLGNVLPTRPAQEKPTQTSEPSAPETGPTGGKLR
jgi:hypothetical protein